MTTDAKIPRRNFSIRRGNSGTIENEDGIVMRFLEPDGTTPQDLTGKVFVFFAIAGEKDFAKDSENGDITIDIAQGTVTIPISVEESRIFPDGEVVYEIEMRNGSGEQRTKLEGYINVTSGLNND